MLMYIDCMVFEYPHNESDVIFSFKLFTGDLLKCFFCRWEEREGVK